MYTTSDTWDSLISGPHTFETRVDINGVSYYDSDLSDISIELNMFDGTQPTVGGCLSGELSLTMFAPSVSIPRMATVNPYVRVTDGDTTSEWIPQGKFFIDTRESSRDDDERPVLSIHAYDMMMKAGGDYPSTNESDWPQTDIDVVEQIAETLGVGVDSRTYDLMTHAYDVTLQTGTMRDALASIAAMYAGNWVMNYDGELLLIAVNGIPKETNYLITAVGSPITFGGVRILV